MSIPFLRRGYRCATARNNVYMPVSFYDKIHSNRWVILRKHGMFRCDVRRHE